jgi:hypothetical protein
MLYFSCAEIGITGAPSATVPVNCTFTSNNVSMHQHRSLGHYIFYTATQAQKQNGTWLLAT